MGNLRIVLFADSHVGSTFDGEGFGELVERMQEEHPDIVVLEHRDAVPLQLRHQIRPAVSAIGRAEIPLI